MRPTQTLIVLPLALLGLVGCASRERVYYVSTPTSPAADAVATTMDIVARNKALAKHNRRVQAARQERAEEEGRRAYLEAADEAAAKHPERCSEVHGLTLPEPAPGHTPPRAIDCNGRLLVEDEQGRWRDYAPANAATQPAL